MSTTWETETKQEFAIALKDMEIDISRMRETHRTFSQDRAMGDLSAYRHLRTRIAHRVTTKYTRKEFLEFRSRKAKIGATESYGAAGH